tara:strand:+ start:2896 stop:3132 length:237 start_codon:yes stop_codon:yes gene_type:complete
MRISLSPRKRLILDAFVGMGEAERKYINEIFDELNKCMNVYDFMDWRWKWKDSIKEALEEYETEINVNHLLKMMGDTS